MPNANFKAKCIKLPDRRTILRDITIGFVYKGLWADGDDFKLDKDDKNRRGYYYPADCFEIVPFEAGGEKESINHQNYENIMKEIHSLLKDGMRLAAIKTHFEYTGRLSLKASKKIIDEIWEKNYKYPYRDTDHAITGS